MFHPRIHNFTGFLPILLIYTIISSIQITVVICQENGRAILKFNWHYENPKQRLYDGKTCSWFKGCQPSFIICLRNAESNYADTCNVYQDERTYKRAGKSHDEEVVAEIPQPLPVTYTMEVKIRGLNWRDARKEIAVYRVNNFKMVPGMNTEPLNFVRTLNKNENKHVKFSGTLKITCGNHYFGPQCERLCSPDAPNYSCDSAGNRICRDGYNGAQCESKDWCQLRPCAAGALCLQFSNNTGRACVCGNDNQNDCYPPHNICDREPCLNDGECIPSASEPSAYECRCQSAWTGPLCGKKRSACLEAVNQNEESRQFAMRHVDYPCRNGGVCKDRLIGFGFTCICTDGWEGEACNVKIFVEETESIAIYYALAVITCILILIVIVIVLSLRRRKANLLKAKRLKVPSTSSETIPLQPIPARESDESGSASAPIIQLPGVPSHDDYEDCTYSTYVDMNDPIRDSHIETDPPKLPDRGLLNDEYMSTDLDRISQPLPKIPWKAGDNLYGPE